MRALTMQAHSCGLGSIVCSRKHAVGTRTGWCIGSSWGSLRSSAMVSLAVPSWVG